jgi:ATP-dependent RNA helicase RhlE
MDDLRGIEKVMKISIPVVGGEPWKGEAAAAQPARRRGPSGRPGGKPSGNGGNAGFKSAKPAANSDGKARNRRRPKKPGEGRRAA